MSEYHIFKQIKRFDIQIIFTAFFRLLTVCEKLIIQCFKETP